MTDLDLDNLDKNWQYWIGVQKNDNIRCYFYLKITNNLQWHKTYLIFSLDEFHHL